MMTVRFPNGMAVQYNNAFYLVRGKNFTDIQDKKDGKLIAQAPNSCLIEFEAPCRVYNALQENQLAEFVKEVRALKRKVGKKR